MTDTLADAPAGRPETAPPLGGRIRDTFVAPTRLVAVIRERAPWLDALGLATAMAAIAVAAEPAGFYLDQMEDPVNRRGVPVEITSPTEQVVLWGRVMALFSALVGHPMLAFAAAGVLTLLFRVIARGEGSFRQYLSIASHGLVILSLGMLFANVLRALTGDPALLPTVGALSGAASDGLTGGVLHGLHLFTIWMLVMLGIAAAALEPRLRRGTATAWLLGGYVALVVTGAALFGA